MIFKIYYINNDKKVSFLFLIIFFNLFMMIMGFNCYTIDKSHISKIKYNEYTISGLNLYGGQITLLLVIWVIFSILCMILYAFIQCFRSFKDIDDTNETVYKEFINEN